MNELIIFVWIASTITIAVNEIKKFFAASITAVFPAAASFQLGVFASLIFSFWAIFSYQSGLLYNVGIEYDNIYFKYFDLTITAFITAGGSAVVYAWIETIRSAKNPEYLKTSGKRNENI